MVSKKCGLLVREFALGQLSFTAAKMFNHLVNDRTDVYPVIFYENLAPVNYQLMFPLMHIAESYVFDGPLMATSISTAHKLITMPNAHKKFFYLWDLEWVRMQQKDFRFLHGLYNHPELNLIARSKEHKEIVENCWNCKVNYIMENPVWSITGELFFNESDVNL